jgi:hypothetical protein
LALLRFGDNLLFLWLVHAHSLWHGDYFVKCIIPIDSGRLRVA